MSCFKHLGKFLAGNLACNHKYLSNSLNIFFFPASEFGAKVVPPKKILKMLPELFDHPDQNVRASSKGLTLELCRWIGKEPVKAILFEKMRDTMVGLFVPDQWISLIVL